MSTDVHSNVIRLLHEIRRLLQLKGENPFKVRAFERAAQELAERDDLLDHAHAGTLTSLPGVGKGIEEILSEYLLHGKCTARDELLASLPPGLVELTQISGIGPKKAMVLIEKLGILTIPELEYACHENRLLKLKGFGVNLQQRILEGITFKKTHQGQLRLSDAMPIGARVLKILTDACPGTRISETGAWRRKAETVDRLEFLVELKEGERTEELGNAVLTSFLAQQNQSLPVELHFSSSSRFGFELARTTGTLDHWKALGDPQEMDAATEEEFYQRLKLPWIPPETRETGEEVSLARSGELAKLLPWDGIRGVFHNHTVRSDGTATLEQMVAAAQEQGLQYIGISDHSQSAQYAQGLKRAQILEQEAEVRSVQEKYPGIRIFWGIESDILADGSLDYDAKILKKFDFVIASIHSRFNHDRKKMTARILKAVRNPYTRFLGHPTGRLLLGRKEYDVDMEAIIAEAAQCDVAIELNSNPARLDLDWRWGPTLRNRKAWTSINPDAHEVAGLKDIQYGIAMARKALLRTDQVVNSKPTNEVEKWLKRV